MRQVDAAGAQSSRSSTQRAASRRSARRSRARSYDLSKVRIESPIDGIVTRRNIQEGETAVIGTMNNAGTVLLTLADMSVIQAEVEVDETNIPNVQLGQPAKITIDAMPDRTFKGHVTEIGNSPIQAAAGTHRRTQATNFKVDGHARRAGPGRAARASPAPPTSRRRRASRSIAVPIPGGDRARADLRRRTATIVREPTTDKQRGAPTADDRGAAAELQARPDAQGTEGVFVVRDGKAVFVPIKMGIAGDKYFEVLVGPEGRRPGHHRPVQLGARHGRRRPGEGRQRRARTK